MKIRQVSPNGENKMTKKILEVQKSGKKSTKTKSTKKVDTHIHFVLDETGSMHQHPTIDGFNEYLGGLRKDKKNRYKMSLTKFDSTGIETIYEALDLKKVPDLTLDTYVPGAMTNLNDAVGHTIKCMEKLFENMKKKCNILLVIMTDGYENASKEFNSTQIAKLIKEKQECGWTVTFLGANIDTQSVGRTYQIDSSNVKSYATSNMGATMRGLSQATATFASTAVAGSSTTDFFAGTEDWTEDASDSSKSSVDISSAVHIPVSKQELFGSLNLDALNVNKQTRSSTTVVKPLKNTEDKDNG